MSRIIQRDNHTIADFSETDLKIRTAQEALDILASAQYEGSDRVIVSETTFEPEFFDLKTGIAGEILQKCSNYGARLAIVGSWEKYTSNALRDFIWECNRGRHIYFVSSHAEAVEKLK